MLTRKHSIEGKHPFGKAAELFNTLDADAAMKLAMVAGDVTLVWTIRGRSLMRRLIRASFRLFPDGSEPIGSKR